MEKLKFFWLLSILILNFTIKNNGQKTPIKTSKARSTGSKVSLTRKSTIIKANNFNLTNSSTWFLTETPITTTSTSEIIAPIDSIDSTIISITKEIESTTTTTSTSTDTTTTTSEILSTKNLNDSTIIAITTETQTTTTTSTSTDTTTTTSEILSTKNLNDSTLIAITTETQTTTTTTSEILSTKDFNYSAINITETKTTFTASETYSKNTSSTRLIYNNITSPNILLTTTANLTKTENSTKREEKFTKEKIHGSLMIFSWIFCASSGILVARYYDFIFRKIVWFKSKFYINVHKFFMTFLCISSVVSFLIILSDLNWKWVLKKKGLNLAHSIVGIIAIGFSIIQLMIGFLKPQKKGFISNALKYIHRLFGISCFVLATVALFIGFFISKINLNNIGWWVMIGWSSWIIILLLLLEFLELLFKFNTDYIQLDNNDPKKEVNQKKEKNLEKFQTVLLVVHFIISASLSTVLIFYICTSNPSH